MQYGMWRGEAEEGEEEMRGEEEEEEGEAVYVGVLCSPFFFPLLLVLCILPC